MHRNRLASLGTLFVLLAVAAVAAPHAGTTTTTPSAAPFFYAMDRTPSSNSSETSFSVVFTGDGWAGYTAELRVMNDNYRNVRVALRAAGCRISERFMDGTCETPDALYAVEDRLDKLTFSLKGFDYRQAALPCATVRWVQEGADPFRAPLIHVVMDDFTSDIPIVMAEGDGCITTFEPGTATYDVNGKPTAPFCVCGTALGCECVTITCPPIDNPGPGSGGLQTYLGRAGGLRGP